MASKNIIILSFIFLIIFLVSCSDIKIKELPKTTLKMKFYDAETKENIKVNYRIYGCSTSDAIIMSEEQYWTTDLILQNRSCLIQANNKDYYYNAFMFFNPYTNDTQQEFYLNSKKALFVDIFQKNELNKTANNITLSLNVANGTFKLNSICIKWSSNIIDVINNVYTESNALNNLSKEYYLFAPKRFYYEQIKTVDKCYFSNMTLTNSNIDFYFDIKLLPSLNENDFIKFYFIDEDLDKDYGYNLRKIVGDDITDNIAMQDIMFEVNGNE